MFYVYQVKNELNGNIYVGAHEGDPTDDYMGSGRLVLHAIEKHGREHFSKIVLAVCESREEMYAKEAELVNAEFVARVDTYNMCVGGNGGPRPNSGPPLGNKCHLGYRHIYKPHRPASTSSCYLTDEWRQKISKTKTGSVRGQEAVEKQRRSLREYWAHQKALGISGRLKSGLRG
jgi:hypothetical protein